MASYRAAVLCVVSLVAGGPTIGATEGPSTGIRPLTFLIGTWHGKSDDGKLIHARYTLTSGDSSIMETLTPEGQPGMTTAYHADGSHLMLTHFCSLNNQPRMRAHEFKDGDKTLTFEFIDATNLKHPTDAHMHRVVFEFKDHDHIVQTWFLMKDGKELPHTFTFSRVKQEGP